MKKLLIAMLALSLSACASTEDLGRGKTGQSVTVAGGSYDQIWNAAIAAIREEKGDQSMEIEKDLTISREDKAKGEIVATSGMSALSWGELVGIYITPPHDAPQHTIEVESRSKMATNLFANNWEEEILASIQRKLGIVQ